MTPYELINNVIGGGLLGILGQGIRIAVGLKKLNDENSANALAGKSTEPFSTSRLIISMFIGFVAGALGMIIKSPEGNTNYDKEFIVTIIAVGYSGADFIEGVFSTYINKTATPVNPPSTKETAKDQPLLLPDEATFPSTPSQG